METKRTGGEAIALPNSTRENACPAESGAKQSRAVNARFAAARRRREQEDAIERATAPLRASLAESRKRAEELEHTVLCLRVQPDMARIHACDPRIRTLGDLSRLHRAGAFYDEVRQGKGYWDAYRSVYADCIPDEKKTLAHPSSADRTHLLPTRQRGGDPLTVPSDTLALYRALNPGLNDDDFRRHFGACTAQTK